MKTRQLKPILALLLAAGTASAFAAPPSGFYLGGSLGVPRYQDAVNGIDGDGSGISGKAFGGYQFTPNFAIETGVMSLGHVEEAAGTVKGHGGFVDAVGIVPLSTDWSLLGRVGVAHVKVKTTNGDDNGTALKFGAGAQYALTSNTSLRGEWERYRPEVFGTRSNIDQYTVGVNVAF